MSEMHVPITDAFDETDRLESLNVELTSKQIEWLREKADERGLSLDHVLRSVVTAQIRAQNESGDEAAPPAMSGDGQPASASTSTEETEERSTADDDNPSIVDSLRSASERLQDLTEQDEEVETPDPHDTLERLQARLGEDGTSTESSGDENPGTVLLQDQNRSMFDMMEEGE